MEHSAGLQRMDSLLRRMDEAQNLAEANSGVVRTMSWAAAQAGAQYPEPWCIRCPGPLPEEVHMQSLTRWA